MPGPRKPIDVDRARAQSRRPLTPDEIPHAEALRAVLRSLRIESGSSATDLAFYSEMARQHLHRIETGIRRTRASTLARLAESLAIRLHVSDFELTVRLIETAGIAIAPETDYLERVNKRRKERTAKNEKRADQHAKYGAILLELRRAQAPDRRMPLRGPDGRFLPDHPTAEKIEEVRQRYHSMEMVLPRLDGEGRFMADDPLLHREVNP
jgi:transcriptional regulator with XRE-family HTH domain